MMVDQIIWIKSREINQQKSMNKVNEELAWCIYFIHDGDADFSLGQIVVILVVTMLRLYTTPYQISY